MRRVRCCWPAQFLRDERIERYEYPLLVLFSALGMCMMVSANSLLALYMALELQSLPIYVLAAIHRDNLRSTEAGLKYFVLGALASGMLLYGCSLVYGFTGTMYFDVLAELLGRASGAALPLGRAGRAGLRRRRAWPSRWRRCRSTCGRPTSTRVRPSPVTAFMAGAPKVAAIGLLLRLLMGPFGHLDRPVAAGDRGPGAGVDGCWAPSPRSARPTSSA